MQVKYIKEKEGKGCDECSYEEFYQIEMKNGKVLRLCGHCVTKLYKMLF